MPELAFLMMGKLLRRAPRPDLLLYEHLDTALASSEEVGDHGRV